MAGQTLAADGGLSDITSLLALVKDQNTTTTNSTNLSQAGVTQQINDILQSTSGLAAVAGAQKSSGLYNSSTNTLLTNDLLSRAASQVAAKNATTTQTTSKKATLGSQATSLLSAGVALKNLVGSDTVKAGAKSVYNSIADELGVDTGSNNVAMTNALNSVSAAGPGAQVGDFTSLESSLAAGNDINAGSTAANLASSAAPTDIANAIAGDAASVGAADAPAVNDVAGLESLDSAASASDAGLGSVDAATAAGGGADVAGLAALDSEAAAGDAAAGTLGAGSGALAATGWGALAVASAADVAGNNGDSNANIADVVGGLGTGDIVRGLDSGNVIDSVNPIGRGLLEAVGVPSTGGWIVCTELLRQGKFNRKHYAAGLKVFHSYPRHLLCGYYVWATPLVLYIRRNPSSWITGCVRHVFAERAEYLAARSGVSGARDTVYGQSISALMFGFCYLLGHGLNTCTALTAMRKEKVNGY